jgi:phage baseplate assembly protein W
MTLPVTDTPTVTVPHLAIPFGLDDDGAALVVEQDTVIEVAQCVRVLLGTVAGSRRVVPDYGIPDPTFGGIESDVIEQAVADWEPRAVVTVTTSPPANTLNVTVGVSLEGDTP